jgi:hypothetical protein
VSSVTSFKAIPVPAYFAFEVEKEAPSLDPLNTNVFVKVSKGKIRKLGSDAQVRWTKDSQVTYFGQDINDVIESSTSSHLSSEKLEQAQLSTQEEWKNAFR